MIPLYHMVPAQNPHHSDTPITNSTPSEESPFSSFPPTEWINGEGQWLKIEADWPSDIVENTKWFGEQTGIRNGLHFRNGEGGPSGQSQVQGKSHEGGGKIPKEGRRNPGEH